MNKISVVITAFNEEKNIKECIESAKLISEDVIVVDNMSTDKTRDIAKKYANHVYQQENDPEMIDIKKNFGFSKASLDWIFCLDADERITKELAEEIKLKLTEVYEETAGFWIPRKNIIFGKWIKSQMWWPDYQLKLFRKGKGKYEKGVHKALAVEGETGKIDEPLLHYNYETVSSYISKLNNYTTIEANTLFEDGYKLSAVDALRFPAGDFLKTFFLEKGYTQGLHGFVLSLLQAFYMEIVFAKLWEKNKFVEVDETQFLQKISPEIKKTKNEFKYWLLTMFHERSKSSFEKVFYKAARKITSRKINNS